MLVPITAFYAGLLGLVFFGLSTRVIRRRRGMRIALMDGDDVELRRRMRIHGNFAEYAPICLILMGLIEANGAPAWLMHPLGLALLASRIMHAVGLTRAIGASRGRVLGMMATFAVLGVASAWAIGQANVAALG